jgi:hypothetical protein
MTTLAYSLTHPTQPELRAHPRLSFARHLPQCQVAPSGELRIYFRHRRNLWRSTASALAFAAAFTGFWFVALSRLA